MPAVSTLVIRTLHVLTLQDLTSVLNPYTGDGNTCNLAAGNNQENCYKSSTLGWEFPYKSDGEANRLYGYKLQVLVSRRGMVFDLSTSKTGSTEGI